jgi:superfamily II DNA or RNA helicase
VAIPVRIAGELFVSVQDLPARVLEQIKSALTFENEEKIKALSIRQFGAWDMPDTVHVWRMEERRGGERLLCLPRGFARQFSAGMAAEGMEIEWIDERVRAPAEPGYWRPIHLRGYQLEAVQAMLAAEQGCYMCPAGGGKTISCLGLAALANQRTLMVTDKVYLANQWRERAAAEFLDPAQTVRGMDLSLEFKDERSIGFIGQDIWEERDFTVALRQTLWARKWELDPTGWWDQWGLVIVDEVHHAAADTLAELCRAVKATLFFGPSATPAKSETRGKVVFALIGPIVAETSRQRLYDEGILIKPHVERVYTDFETDFWPDHSSELDDDGQVTCLMPKCPKTKKGVNHTHKNNYTSVVKKLVEDEGRNALIASRIVDQRGHIHLVYSRQLKHLDALAKACKKAGWDGPIYKLRGEENASGEAREIAAKVISDDEAIIFSTVAEEGMDIPPIDRTHIVFPMKQDASVVQLVGRGERTWEGKEDSIVNDYVDSGVNVFAGHAGDRYRVYLAQGYVVKDVASATAEAA